MLFVFTRHLWVVNHVVCIYSTFIYTWVVNHVVCIYSTFIYTWVVKKCFIFLRLDTWNFDTMAVTIISRKSESDALHLYPEGSSTTNSKAKKSRHLTANTIKTVTIAVKSQLCNVWYLICMHVTPSQRNSQSVLFSCSLPPARFDLISPAWGQFQASAGFLGACCLATRRFQNGCCSFKIQPHSLTFTKISHHSSHLLIFGMLSPV